MSTLDIGDECKIFLIMITVMRVVQLMFLSRSRIFSKVGLKGCEFYVLTSNLVKTDLRNFAVSFEIRRFSNTQAETTL